jgi:tungstate transport system permease protein
LLLGGVHDRSAVSCAARIAAADIEQIRALDTFSASFQAALDLLLQADAYLYGIVGLSLRVSCIAVLLAALVGLPVGALLAVAQFPGRRTLTVIINGFMGLPAVVVGLAVYLLLSRAGPLGQFGLLFTPPARCSSPSAATSTA